MILWPQCSIAVLISLDLLGLKVYRSHRHFYWGQDVESILGEVSKVNYVLLKIGLRQNSTNAETMFSASLQVQNTSYCMELCILMDVANITVNTSEINRFISP